MGKTRRPNTRYSPEFKISVILDMRENGLSCHETVRKYWQTKTHAEGWTKIEEKNVADRSRK